MPGAQAEGRFPGSRSRRLRRLRLVRRLEKRGCATLATWSLGTCLETLHWSVSPRRGRGRHVGQ
jgi:hypothetical protein